MPNKIYNYRTKLFNFIIFKFIQNKTNILKIYIKKSF